MKTTSSFGVLGNKPRNVLANLSLFNFFFRAKAEILLERGELGALMFYIGKPVHIRRIFSLIVIIIIYQRLLLLKFSRAQIACGYLWLWLLCYCSEDIEIPKEFSHLLKFKIFESIVFHFGKSTEKHSNM